MALRRNILLFHHGALGDFVVTWPLGLGLGRAFAQSRVFYVVAGQKGALAERALRVDSADVEWGWHQLFSEEPQLPERAARLLEGATRVVNFVSGAEDLWARNVRRLAPEAELITLRTVPPDAFEGHVTEYLLEQLKPWPVIEAAARQMLRSVATRGLGLWRGASAGGPIVLHPGAGAGKKCWPAESFLELASQLRASGRAVCIVIGEVEREQWPPGRTEAFAESADELIEPATLVELMEALSAASAFVGNDSGPGHLAAMMGVPTISIFGPKDPRQWKPLGPSVQVVAGDWRDISVERVIEVMGRAAGS